MDHAFKRNFVIFIVILLGCVALMGYFIVQSEKEFGHTDDLLVSTHRMIAEAEQLSSLTEGMLASQRGYILTGEESFLKEYRDKKAGVSDHIALLDKMSIDNPEQQARIRNIRQNFNDFASELEERAALVTPSATSKELKEVKVIDNLRDDIFQINATILKTETNRLNRKINDLEDQKNVYFTTLLVGMVIGTALLLLFNAFLLKAQKGRSSAETSLKGAEERLVMAMEGTQDGIFDWDIKKDTVFVSDRFHTMLGYVDKPNDINLEYVENLLHPEDLERFSVYVDLYVNGRLSEYNQEFRLKHASGRWVWIQSRAKGVFDKNGKAIRMVGAHTDITPLMNTQEKLEQEKKYAEMANSAKSEFLAHMSHEIRTPLTAISGIAEILANQKASFNEKQVQLVQTLGSSTSSLKELVNDILDFSKIESGELDLDEHNFDLGTFFEAIISMMAVRASEKSINFVCDYTAVKDVAFYGDDGRLRQVLVNLIGNAIKFTDDGDVIITASLAERKGEECLRIDVADTGIGIDAGSFDVVFERFKQGDTSVSRKYGGTGLGLPISRQLVRLMEGEITLSSEAGKGSTFTVFVPHKIVDEKVHKGNKIARNKKMAELNSLIRDEAYEETKVLVAEDYEGNIVVISHILEELNLSFDIAKTGKAAVDLWRKDYYDIVLMDVQMPEMDGFTATAEIRKAEKTMQRARTPVIGMTAHALVGDRDKCIEAGMDAYLPKPLVEADLKHEILEYLKEKKTVNNAEKVA